MKNLRWLTIWETFCATVAVALCLGLLFGAGGCGSSYSMGYENPSVGIVWKVDTGLWLEAKNSRADFTGTWPNGEEEPWPVEPEDAE